MRVTLTILLINLAIFSGSASRAEVLEYDIEIVIFEDATNRYINSEEWKKIESDQLPDTTRPDENQADENLTPNIIENKVSSLQKYATRLERSTRYNVLTHKAWRQTGLDAKSAIDVYIDSTENKATLNKKTSITNTAVNSNIKGTVKVILGRYLHIYTDMIYQKPNPLYTNAASPLDSNTYKEYRIKSHRRMRSKVLHYIDHPLIGMLVIVTPVEVPEEEMDQLNIEHEKSSLNGN